VVALERKNTALGVSTGEGMLGVLRVQLEGKRVMSAAEFLRGQRDWVGMVLPSK
jgi:methionyl-tRNA formyltransferase